jgi:hypothetical protein
MPDDLASTSLDRRYSDIVHRWRQLSVCATGIIPTRIPLEPTPEDIATVADDLRVLARHADALIEAYGKYIDANAPGIERALFEDVLYNAIDGNALYEIERLSQRLRDDIAERTYYARHNNAATE